MPTNTPNLRIGMIALTDPDDPNQLSGMPYRMMTALREQGCSVIPVRAGQTDPTDDLMARVSGRIARAHRRRSPLWLKRLVDNAAPGRTQRSIESKAHEVSARVAEQLAQTNQPLDLLFGCCIASALIELSPEKRNNLPVVYFSDATNLILNKTYPLFMNRGRAYKDTRAAIERAAITNTTTAAFASAAARDSAIEHLGADPSRSFVVPMGAHITPADPGAITSPATPPSNRDCKLLIVAADPLRKRVDLAVQATERLRAQGITATLHVVGRGTRASHRSKFVVSEGPLLLSDPDHAQRHRDLLRTSHIQLLPSLGEAFGIAPAESAHYARPSIVSETGGLPSVVLNDETGITLPVNAPAQAWANAIATLLQDPARYRELSANALARARSDLNWSAWATSMINLMHQTLASHRAEPHVLHASA